MYVLNLISFWSWENPHYKYRILIVFFLNSVLTIQDLFHIAGICTIQYINNHMLGQIYPPNVEQMLCILIFTAVDGWKWMNVVMWHNNISDIYNCFECQNVICSNNIKFNCTSILPYEMSNMHIIYICVDTIVFNFVSGPRWLNELGRWI
jgi:hypothetical protein